MKILAVASAAILVAAVGGAFEPSVHSLPCTPVGVYPPTGGWSADVDRGPRLHVVDSDLRPRRTHLFLDGRRIGRADDFDGRPGYLYLEPGRYRLEARLGGYRTAVFEIVAKPGCRADLKHRMERVPSEAKEGRGDGPSPDRPLERVFGPLRATPAVVQDDPDGPTGPAGGTESSGRQPARLRLSVRSAPDASIYLDGIFLATPDELARLQEALVVAPGPHLVEVLAPGRPPVVRRVSAQSGQTATVDIVIGPSDG